MGGTIRDFEEAVLSELRRLAGAECVVTRDARDFLNSPLRIFDPAELLASFGK